MRIASAAGEEKRRLVDCVALPARFCNGDSFSCTMSLPEEFCKLRAMPLQISGDLCFTYTGKSANVVWAEHVMTAELRAVDFLSNRPEEVPPQPSPGNSSFPLTVPRACLRGGKRHLVALSNALLGGFTLSLFDSRGAIQR